MMVCSWSLNQIPLHLQKKKKVQKMALFVVFVYLRAWFTAPALVSAASKDISLYERLGLGLATRLNTTITRKEEGFEELIQVVEAHYKSIRSLV